MRLIEVSTDVFAKIWAHRIDGEESEDAILDRLLNAGRRGAPEPVAAPGTKALWRDDVRAALEALGGTGHLSQVYTTVRNTRRSAGRSVPYSTDAIVRRELEYCSSDSESFQGEHDWFRSVDGLGKGVWALR